MQDPDVPFTRLLPVSHGHELFDVAVECWLVLSTACFEYWPLDQRVTWVSTPVSLPHHRCKSLSSTWWSVFFNAKHWRGQSSNQSTTWILSIEWWSTTLKLSICWYGVRNYCCLACNGNPKLYIEQYHSAIDVTKFEIHVPFEMICCSNKELKFISFPFSLNPTKDLNVCSLHQLSKSQFCQLIASMEKQHEHWNHLRRSSCRCST